MIDATQTATTLHLLPETDHICMVIKRAFSTAECQQLLNSAKELGFHKAQDKYPSSYRNNARLQVDDGALAATLYERLLHAAPRYINSPDSKCVLIKLNERLRYCRYSRGQRFSIHQDGTFRPNPNEESKLTMLLYLNDASEYAGGATVFYDAANGQNILASYFGEVGDVLIFEHGIWHSGETVTENDKFILRSDLIYRVERRHTQRRAHHDDYIWKLIRLPDGRIASAARDKTIRIWSSKLQLQQKLVAHDNSVFDLACSETEIFGVSRDGFLSIWQQENGTFSLKARVDSGHPSATCLALWGDYIITGGSDGMLRKWDNNGRLLKTVRVSEGWIWKILSVGNNRCIVCTSEGELQYLNPKSLRLMDRPVQLNSPLRCMAAGHSRLYVGDESGRIFKLACATLTIEDSWQAHSTIVRDLLLCGDNVISCGEDGKVVVSENSSRLVRKLFTHKNFATSLCWLDSANLLSSAYTGRIERHSFTPIATK